ncbi:MAG: hypothetical protein Q9157_000793 [Trypethelium eluteriae]
MADKNASQKDHVVINADFFDSMGADYEKAFGHDVGLHNFIKRAVTFFPPAATVLDIGCGTGTPVASTVAAHGHRIIGIDSSQSMVDLSRKAVPSGTFEVVDMKEYSPKEKIDVVLSILSLFQLSREQIEFMSGRWADWLAPGGILCIGTMDPAELDLKDAIYDEDKMCVRGISHLFMGEPGHLILMTREGWGNMLRTAGFEVIETEKDTFEPPPEAKCDPEPHYFVIARKIS